MGLRWVVFVILPRDIEETFVFISFFGRHSQIRVYLRSGEESPFEVSGNLVYPKILVYPGFDNLREFV